MIPEQAIGRVLRPHQCIEPLFSQIFIRKINGMEHIQWWQSLSESKKAMYWDIYTNGMSDHSEAKPEQILEIYENLR